MTTIRQTPVSTGPAARVHDVRRFRRYVAALVLLVPATSVGIGRLFQTNDDDTRRALDQIATNPHRQFVFALLGYIAIVTLVPAFLAAGRLSRRRRPVLTTIALGVNLVAYLGAWAMGAVDNLFLIGGQLPPGQRDTAAVVIDKMYSSGLAGVSTGLFVLGHVIGAILMGFALRGSIPAIGWLAMVLTTPAHVVAFVVLQQPVVDMAAWFLMSLSFAYCAIAVLRTSDDDWDIAPLRS